MEEKLNQEIIEFGEEIFKVYGLDSLSAKIMSILYFEPGELSMEELADMTGYSLASISLKMGQLETYWGIKRKKIPGSRKAYFYMTKNYLELIEESFRKGFELESSLAKKHLPRIIKECKSQASSDYDLEKLKILEDYCHELDGVKTLLDFVTEKVEEIQKQHSMDG